MDFRFTPQQEQFRHEVRDFLRRELGSDLGRGRGVEGFSQAFAKKLAARSWIGMAWPKEYGGRDLSMLEQLIYKEEMARADAPTGYHYFTEGQVGPSLILRGSDEQKAEYLPKIISADISFCIGMSEPGAGSDLAAVGTRAVRDGDEYVVNGQKIWTSSGHQADMMWLVTRTDPTVPKHKGISILILDMHSPGITVRPLINMADHHNFNEVFFEDVRIPVRNRVGEENRGWYILAEHLDFERSGIERIVGSEHLLDATRDYVRSWPASHPNRHRAGLLLADLQIRLEVGRLITYRVAWMQSRGRVPNYEASMSKVFASEWTQRVANAAVGIAGLHGIAGNGDDRFLQQVRQQYPASVANTIAAGTSEIQRNIIATRGLGLPRG